VITQTLEKKKDWKRDEEKKKWTNSTLTKDFFLSVSKSAAGEIMGTRWRFLALVYKKCNTKKKLPILRRKVMLNKVCI